MESGGGLIGVVALCGGVGLVGAQGARHLGRGGLRRLCIHRRGRKEGPSQLVCTVYDGHETP